MEKIRVDAQPVIAAVVEDVDVSGLETDQDFEREAERLAPVVIEGCGKNEGEKQWAAYMKEYGGLQVSDEEREKHIAETVDEFSRTCTEKDSALLRADILEALRNKKSAG